MPKLTIDRIDSVRALRNGLFALLDYDLTVVQALCLIEVALSQRGPQEVTITTLSDRLKIAESTATRAVDVLGTEGRGTRKGLGLVRRDFAPGDRRIKVLRLTAKGERLLGQMAGGAAVA